MRVDRSRRLAPRMGFWLLIPGVLSSSTAIAEVRPGLTGKLTKIKGVRVLKLWGSPYDRGFAHGFLLADDILGLLESALLDPRVLPDPAAYEQKVLPTVAAKMEFATEYVAELTGMLGGITAARGPKGIKLQRLDRPLTRADLEAMNTLADWYRLGCSSFSAWDDNTQGRQMITARNLDFFDVPGTRTAHLLIAYVAPGPGRKSWVSIAWPGLIGAYTAMNEDGVTISMHDAPGRNATFDGRYVPRSLALRDAIETASPITAVADVKRVLLAEHSICGNNIHVSGPFLSQRNPAAVFEYDGDVTADGGVTVRLSADEKSLPLRTVLLCTNHYRKRGERSPCERFETMKKFFETPRPAGRKIDVDLARQVMRSVSRDDTLHSVVFLPNRKEFWVSFADAAENATHHPPVRLKLADLLNKK